MRPLEDLSGPWAGWWIQGEVRGQETLSLEFAQGRIRGHGSDRDGTFQISGHFKSDRVDLMKGYALLTVRYQGRWDGATISGEWRIGTREATISGPFEMWPLGDEMSLQEFMVEEELVGASPAALPGPITPSLPSPTWPFPSLPKD